MQLLTLTTAITLELIFDLKQLGLSMGNNIERLTVIAAESCWY